jgi:hypothetical protein
MKNFKKLKNWVFPLYWKMAIQDGDQNKTVYRHAV